MRFVEYVDYGDTPVLFISGPADISLVDDVIEVVLYVRVKLDDGTFENRVAARLRQSSQKYFDDGSIYAEARTHIVAEAGKLRRLLVAH